MKLFFMFFMASWCALPSAHDRPADRAAIQAPETAVARDARMRWWREARFGMFIHWGLYAVPAGEFRGTRSKDLGEWIMSWANIPRAEYESFAGQFNPVRFNAAEWVRVAKNAGMNYIVITAKHHDGFAMFNSAVSAYDITDATPYKRDVLKALSAEAKKQGLRFCVYYSIMDWHHPSQFVSKAGKDPTAGDNNTEMRPGQKAEYVAYMKAQLKELVRQYDPDVLWFDGEWVNWWTEVDGEDLYAYLRFLKPSILVNNRVGKGRKGMDGLNKSGRQYAGDFGTPEQQVPPTGLSGVDWESCMTMNDTWGFKAYDDNWASARTLIRTLVDVASKGGNYLLNVGPTDDGLIPGPSVERLAEVGRWMKVNGQAIYRTTASPFATPLPWGRATSAPDTLYLIVFDWPRNGVLRVPSFGRTVTKAALLASPKIAVTMATASDGLTLTVPTRAPDSSASVIALTLAR